MIEAINLLAAVSMIQVFVYEVVPMIKYIDRKPFNCSSCLSFWTSVILFCIFLNPIYLILPILTRLYEKYS